MFFLETVGPCELKTVVWKFNLVELEPEMLAGLEQDSGEDGSNDNGRDSLRMEKRNRRLLVKRPVWELDIPDIVESCHERTG